MNQTTEEKFLYLISLSTDKFSLYLQSVNGFLKLEYRPEWQDGLGNRNLIRIINKHVGLSTAPSSWEHVEKVLELNEVDFEEFGRSLDRRINRKVLAWYRDLQDARNIFGDEYIYDLIDRRGNISLKDDTLSPVQTLVKKPKPHLSIVKGDDA